MIQVTVTKKDSKYQKLSIMGHALYDDYGKDIVCSACSSIVITTVNGLLALNHDSLIYEVKKDGVVIHSICSDDITQTLIHNMINLLKELEGNYPENIEVK